MRLVIREDEGRLEIISPMPWLLRIGLALFSLVFLWAAYEAFGAITWTVSVSTFFEVILALLPFSAWAFVMLIAFAGVESSVAIEKHGRRFMYTESSPIKRRVTREFPVGTVASVELEEDRDADSGKVYRLVFTMQDGERLKTTTDDSLDNVRDALARARRFLHSVSFVARDDSPQT